MKKPYFSILPILILAFIFNFKEIAIGQNKTGWEKQNLKGTVASISKRTYVYEEGKKGKWDMSNHGYLFESGMMHDYDITFDKVGNMLTKISYKAIKRENDSIRYQYRYEYNTSNQIEKEIEVYESGPLETIISYEYDSENKLIKIDKNKGNKYGKGHYDYQYESNGYLEKETFYGKRGSPKYKIEYVNNTSGQKVKAVKSTYHSRKRSWNPGDRNEYSYNDNNQLIELLKYFKDGRLTNKYQYEYDQFGNLIIEKRFRNKDEIAFTIKFEYTFDSENNWTNCIVYKSTFNHDSPMYIVEREIKYR